MSMKNSVSQNMGGYSMDECFSEDIKSVTSISLSYFVHVDQVD